MSRLSVFLVLAAFAICGLSASTPALAQSLQPESVPDNPNGISDPAEYKAYLAAIGTQDPYVTAAFVLRYPQSGVITEVLEHLIAQYLQASYPQEAPGYSNSDAKVLELARRLRETESNDLRALAVITEIDRIKVTAAQMTEALGEMCPDSLTGLHDLPGWQKPDGMTASEFKKQRTQIEFIFDGAAGLCALQRKDYVEARDFYVPALRLNPRNLADLYQVTIADLEMNPIDADGFWYCGRFLHSLRVDKKDRDAKSLDTYCKAKFRKYHGGDEGWEQIVRQAATENTLPPGLASQLKDSPKVH
jgi:tetratricopeptide (TPR) repeat protein